MMVVMLLQKLVPVQVGTTDASMAIQYRVPIQLRLVLLMIYLGVLPIQYVWSS